MSEHNEQVQVCKYLDLLKVLYFAIPNGIFIKNKNRFAIIKKQKDEGLKKGVPDLFICEPNKSFSGLFIEMKNKTGGKTEPEQKEWKRLLNNKGYKSVICKGFIEAKKVIDEYLN